MSDSSDYADAIGAADDLLASVGLESDKRAPRASAERVRPGSGTLPAAVPRTPSPGIERIPAWDRFTWLRAGWSTRKGGRSSVYGKDEQNLGWTSHDQPEIVAANRKHFMDAATEGAVLSLVTVHQVHGGLILDLEQEPAPWMTPDGKACLRADGLMSLQPGRLLGILTADCVPILLADTRTHAVAALHAGWRGTLARIVERGIGSLKVRYGSRPEDLVAAIGPCIGSCCFAVGEEVRTDFTTHFNYAPELFSEVHEANPTRDESPLPVFAAGTPGHSDIGPQLHMDLVEANRRQLLDAGLAPDAISVLGECTACSRLPDGTRKYYSHRAEHGFAGRMLSVIGAVAS